MFTMSQMDYQTSQSSNFMNNSKIKVKIVLIGEIMCTTGQSITIAIKDVFTLFPGDFRCLFSHY